MKKCDHRYGWVIVAVGALMGCVAVGAMMSLAVFAVGLGAVAIALAFPRPSSGRALVAEATAA